MSSARNAPSSMRVIDGMSRTVDASTSRPTARTEQAQPDRGEQARVQREEHRARRVEQPFDGPRLPADAAAHGVGALVAARSTAAAPRSTTDAAKTMPTASVAGHEPGERRAEERAAGSSAPRIPCAMTSPPTANDAIGSRASATDDTAYAQSQRVRRGGRVRGPARARRRRRARPESRPTTGRRARGRTRPSPARSRRADRSGCPARGCCGCRPWRRRRCAPRRPADVAVDPVAGEIHLRLDRGAVADLRASR